MTLGNSTETKIEDAYHMPTGIDDETKELLDAVSGLLKQECKIQLSPRYLMAAPQLGSNRDKIERILALDLDTQKKAQKIFEILFPKEHQPSGTKEAKEIKEVIGRKRGRVYNTVIAE